jgi:hypothetical protein
MLLLSSITQQINVTVASHETLHEHIHSALHFALALQ